MKNNMTIDKEKIKESIDLIKSKGNTIYFFLPSVPGYLVSIYEFYRHANILRNEGYKVKFLTDEAHYNHPDWFETSLTEGFEVLFVGDEKAARKVQIGQADVIVIPEMLTNVMNQLENIKCQKIVLVQSFDAAVGSLSGGVNYNTLKIKDVLTTSQTLKGLCNEYLGIGLNIKSARVGIPSYFKRKKTPKKFNVSFLTRNANDITKVVKMLYSKYPSLRALGFDALDGYKREEFAERLSDSFMVIWLDRIASFGTLPLEAMQSGTIVAGLIPDIQPEYMKPENGLWAYTPVELVDVIARTAMQWLENEIDPELYKNMDETVAKYSEEKSADIIRVTYQEFFTERVSMFEKYIIE